MSDVIDVLFCGDPGYFQHMAVAGVSLARNCPGARLRLHVLTCDRDPAAEARLRRSFAPLPNVTLVLHRAEAEAVGDLFVDKFLSKECYLRLLAAEILPPEVRRFLYLDCDVVVVDDIRPLWRTALGDTLLAAAPDHPRLPEFMSAAHRAALGIPQEAVYVNSGVLVVDAEGWRREGMAARILAYVREKGSKLTFHDQDTINAVLAGRITLLDPRWNLQARMFLVGRRAMPEDFAATRAARRHPGIIHFTGSEKPWKFRARMARKRDYFRYLAETDWRGEMPAGTGPLQRAEHAAGQRLACWLAVDYLEVIHKTRRLGQILGQIPRQILRGRAAQARGRAGRRGGAVSK